MLLGEDLGGGHERGLGALLEGHDHREQRHHGLARAHVALHEAVHGVRRAQVVGDLPQHPFLRRGQRERQDALHHLAGLVRDLESGPLPLRPQAAPAAGQAELEKEELLEDQPDVRGTAEAVEGVEVRVPHQMDASEGGGAPDHRQSLADGRGERVFEGVRDLLGEVDEDPPQRLAGERAELLVDRHDAAAVDARLVGLHHLVLGRGHDELARAIGIAFDRAVQHHPLPAGQDVLQEGLIEPEGLEPPAPVVEPDLVEGHPPRPPETRHRDLPRHADPHAGPQVRHPSEAPPVLVANGQVQEQVFGGANAHLLEGGRPLGTDAFRVLDGPVEVHAWRPIIPRERGARGPDARACPGPRTRASPSGDSRRQARTCPGVS